MRSGNDNIHVLKTCKISQTPYLVNEVKSSVPGQVFAYMAIFIFSATACSESEFHRFMPSNATNQNY
jgi:hypothetical protein